MMSDQSTLSTTEWEYGTSLDKVSFKKTKTKTKTTALPWVFRQFRTRLKHLWLRLQNPLFLNLGTPGFRDISTFFSEDPQKRCQLGRGHFHVSAEKFACVSVAVLRSGPPFPTPTVVSTVCLGPSSGLLQTRCSELRINIYIPDGWSPDGLWEPPAQQTLLKLKRLKNKPEYSCWFQIDLLKV